MSPSPEFDAYRSKAGSTAAAPAASAPPARPAMPTALASTEPFAVGTALGRTFSTWSKNLVPFALLSLFTQGPNFVFAIWTQFRQFGGYPSFQDRVARAAAAPALGGSYWGVFSAVMLLTVVLTFVQMAALTYGGIQHLAGRRVTFGALVGAGFRRSWSVFATGFVAALLILLATLLLVVPGIIVACAAVAAVPAVVAEPIGPGEAVQRSFALTKGRRFRIFVTYLVLFVVAWVAAAISGFLPLVLGGGTASLIGACIGFLVTAAVTPLWTLFPAVAYHDLRVEKEGVDTAELAKVFE